MDAELYDEFGNYVGPDLDSDDEDDAEEAEQYVDDDEQQEYDVSLKSTRAIVKVTTF